MSTLRTLRDELVTALTTTEVQAFGHLPDRLAPPARIVEPAEPYVTDDDDDLPFGAYRVAFDVFLLGRRATNAVQVDAVDDEIQTVLELLDTSRWLVRNVGQPFALVIDEARTYPTVIVRVTTDTTL